MQNIVYKDSEVIILLTVVTLNNTLVRSAIGLLAPVFPMRIVFLI
jgi:hypothetical protein